MAKVLAIDLDGTLFYPKKRVRMIPRKNVKFIRHFIDEGNKVVICSGRNLPYAQTVIEKINRPLDVIGCNSSFIISDNKVIHESMLTYPLVGKIVDELKEHFNINAWLMMSKDQSLVIAGEEMGFLKRWVYKLVYACQGVYAEKYVISNEVFDEEIKKGQVYKLMMFFGLGKKGKEKACEATKYLRKNYSDKIEASWTDNFIEITAANVSKSNGLLTYCDYLHLDKNDIYVVGDSGNDISMFQTFQEHSFCMKHASYKVKKFAKYHIDMVADIEDYLGGTNDDE